MFRKSIVLVTALLALSWSGLVAEAAPVPTAPPATGAVPTMTTNAVGPPQPRKWTKRAKSDAKLAIKIHQKAQRGRTLDWHKARRVVGKRHKVLSGYVRGFRAGGGRVAGLPSPNAVGPVLQSITPQGVPKCYGINDSGLRPYGYRWRLDSCNTLKLELMSVGVAATAGLLGAVLPDSNQTKYLLPIIEFTFTLGAIELQWCNRRKTGVRIFYIVGTGSVFCRKQ